MSLLLYRLSDANLWTGVHRRGIPTVVVSLRLCEWGLPFALHIGGHLLSKPGLTFVVGPLHISWSRL
jgi:hypothetical protein